MKVPKQVNKYCPKCKAYKIHKVSQVKNKPRPKTKKGALGWGIRQMARISAGYGGFPRPKKPKTAKQSKKIAFVYECTECGRKHTKREPIRSKKIEQI